ncbi:MAG: hypothetical protein JWO19_5755 [Bryobacterales bacterium]|nr:hypothetical protein [Bryobacterales bacterium]
MDRETFALLIVLTCSMACLCSRWLRAAEQSEGTNSRNSRMLASWAVQTMELSKQFGYIRAPLPKVVVHIDGRDSGPSRTSFQSSQPWSYRQCMLEQRSTIRKFKMVNCIHQDKRRG